MPVKEVGAHEKQIGNAWETGRIARVYQVGKRVVPISVVVAPAREEGGGGGGVGDGEVGLVMAETKAGGKGRWYLVGRAGRLVGVVNQLGKA